MYRTTIIAAIFLISACKESSITYTRFTGTVNGVEVTYGARAVDFEFNLTDRRYLMDAITNIPQVFLGSDRYCYSNHEDMEHVAHPPQTRLDAVCFVRRDNAEDLFVGTLYSVPN